MQYALAFMTEQHHIMCSGHILFYLLSDDKYIDFTCLFEVVNKHEHRTEIILSSCKLLSI